MVQRMKQRLARFVMRNGTNPAYRASVRLIEKMGIKEPIARMLFQGDIAKRPRKEANEASAPVQFVRGRLGRIASSGKPIVVGPWVSEIGFELLYWTPFLRWAIQRYDIDPSRVTVVSRGGVKSWYAGIGDKYVDIFGTFTPDEYRELNKQRWMENAGLQKQTFQSSFDEKILDRVASQLGDYDVLHPELMYLLFDDYWSGHAGLRRYTDHATFRRLKKPFHEISTNLPEKYIAAKFYGRPSFPMTDDSRAFVRDFVLQLAEESPVVFITTDLNADDHGDFPAPKHPNIMTVNQAMRPSDNLMIQSAVIAGASRVACTYGGFAYLPLLYGVPTVGFYSVDKHFMKIHGSAAYQFAFNMKAPLSVLHFRTLDQP